MSYAVGSLVKARGREWVVLPESSDDLLVLRPLGGTDDEIAGIYLPDGESVQDATFAPPEATRVGDHRSCQLLRQAARLSIRAGAGPFRSFAGIAVEPRSYQLVPLLMALKLNPVRLLISDDVGIGKTVEAGLVAKELLERGEANGLCVLCPPHLAEQWQRELREKFHIEAELVLASTAARLERGCTVGQSLFDVHREVIVSMDFIKSERRRQDFLRACPSLVLVDEAHTCAFGSEGRGRQLRNALVKSLSEVPERHLVLITATPHSGKEEAFRSLIGFLDGGFKDLPADMTGAENAPHRRRLAAHFVQRRRADIRQYLGEDTPFPDRLEAELTYDLDSAYRKFFDRVLDFARETVEEAGEDKRRQRIRWWSALALLRSVGSSPPAAAQTFRNRAPTLEAESSDAVDSLGEETVLDLEDVEGLDGLEVAAGADYSESEAETQRVRRRLLGLAREAEGFVGKTDSKLQGLIKIVGDLLKKKHNPIVFCRFIPTVHYVAEHLRKQLSSKITVDAITGELTPSDREKRVEELGTSAARVLVCTDCLSEGINLQEHFDAVVHYDLAWNPTRHEQREGRADRYGQPKKEVRTVLYYGANNPVDGLILDVLIRKHRTIKSSLGISVPIPMDSGKVVEALLEGLLFKRGDGPEEQGLLPGFEPPVKKELEKLWTSASEREKRSRTMFAQETIKPEEVARELEEMRRAIGTRDEVEAFTRSAIDAYGGRVADGRVLDIDLREAPRALRDATGLQDRWKVRFELPVDEGVQYLTRTHPFVSGLASYVMDTALDEVEDAPASRCGAIRTDAVSTRTTLLLLRDRFHITAKRGDRESPLLAEDSRLLAFTGSPESPTWLDPEQTEALLAAEPRGNINPDQARDFVRKVTDALPALTDHLEATARERADHLLQSHLRVREAARIKGVRYEVEPKLPVDVLGVFVFLPAG